MSVRGFGEDVRLPGQTVRDCEAIWSGCTGASWLSRGGELVDAGGPCPKLGSWSSKNEGPWERWERRTERARASSPAEGRKEKEQGTEKAQSDGRAET